MSSSNFYQVFFINTNVEKPKLSAALEKKREELNIPKPHENKKRLVTIETEQSNLDIERIVG